MLFTRTGVRAIARVLVVAGLAAGSLTAAGGAASAADQLPPVVTLSASHTTLGAGEWVQLSAEASYNEYNLTIEIRDEFQNPIASCTNTRYCSTYHYEWTTTSRTFVAVVRNQGSLAPERSASNPVTVYWHDETAMTMTASPPVTRTGLGSQLDVAVDTLESGYIQIWDITNGSAPVLVDWCWAGTTCSTYVTKSTAGHRDFVALLHDYWYTTYSPWYSEAQSGVVRVGWVDQPPPPPVPTGSTASHACNAGQQVIESTTEGVRVKMYVLQPSANETHVCVRAENALNGNGVGGQFIITPTVPTADVQNVQTPSYDDASNACTTTAGNSVPSSHPIAAGGAANTPYLLDVYGTTAGAWVCLQAGTTKIRAKVPVAVPQPSVTPGTQVRFNADPGTPDLI